MRTAAIGTIDIATKERILGTSRPPHSTLKDDASAERRDRIASVLDGMAVMISKIIAIDYSIIRAFDFRYPRLEVLQYQANSCQRNKDDYRNNPWRS